MEPSHADQRKDAGTVVASTIQKTVTETLIATSAMAHTELLLEIAPFT